MALTAKKKKFAHGLVLGMSNREAAIHADYSEKTASTKGAMLAKETEIIEYVEQLKNAQPADNEVQVGNEKVKQVVLPEIITNSDLESAHEKTDPLDFLTSVFSNPNVEMKFRVAAAGIAMPYVHGKIAATGKKEGKVEGAKAAAQSKGRFGTLDSQTRPS